MEDENIATRCCSLWEILESVKMQDPGGTRLWLASRLDYGSDTFYLGPFSTPSLSIVFVVEKLDVVLLQMAPIHTYLPICSTVIHFVPECLSLIKKDFSLNISKTCRVEKMFIFSSNALLMHPLPPV